MSEFKPVRKVIADSRGQAVPFQPVRKVEEGEEKPLGLKEQVFKNVVRPGLEMGGMIGGGLIGGGLGTLAGVPTGPGAALTGLAGGIAGGGLGYSMGSQLADIGEAWAGIAPPKALPERMAEAGKDVATGMAMEAGGRTLPALMPHIGKAGKQVVGKLTGTGTESAEQAVLASESFKRALRGKISPQEIVDHARGALSILKDQRGSAYRTRLAEISKNQQPIDMKPITDELTRLMKTYDVRLTPQGNLDLSRMKMGKAGRSDIEDLIMDIQSWGSKPGDNTVLGLDTLKGRIGDFYSDSSQARQFVESLRNVVDKTIKAAEPRYAEMTKGYENATKLIKDIESNLMMRKEGINGRITADQTLRRLTSAMKDNFELRKDLVQALGNQSAMEVMPEVAGYAMSTWTPRGLSGSGLAFINATMAYMISPKIWPVLAASSPRISAEFLMAFSKGMKEVAGAGKIVNRAIPYAIGSD